MKDAFNVLAMVSPTSHQIATSHEKLSVAMKDPEFLSISIGLLLESQASNEILSKLILSSLSTYLKHQQAKSSLVARVNIVTLNNQLLALFVDRSIMDKYRKMLLRSYTTFIFSHGSKYQITQCRPFEPRLWTPSRLSSSPSMRFLKL